MASKRSKRRHLPAREEQAIRSPDFEADLMFSLTQNRAGLRAEEISYPSSTSWPSLQSCSSALSPTRSPETADESLPAPVKTYFDFGTSTSTARVHTQGASRDLNGYAGDERSISPASLVPTVVVVHGGKIVRRGWQVEHYAGPGEVVRFFKLLLDSDEESPARREVKKQLQRLGLSPKMIVEGFFVEWLKTLKTQLSASNVTNVRLEVYGAIPFQEDLRAEKDYKICLQSAAKVVGMDIVKLQLTAEAEAASYSWDDLRRDAIVFSCDAGGGTFDLVIYAIRSNQREKLHHPIHLSAGGETVFTAYKHLVKELYPSHQESSAIKRFFEERVRPYDSDDEIWPHGFEAPSLRDDFHLSRAQIDQLYTGFIPKVVRFIQVEKQRLENQLEDAQKGASALVDKLGDTKSSAVGTRASERTNREFLDLQRDGLSRRRQSAKNWLESIKHLRALLSQKCVLRLSGGGTRDLRLKNALRVSLPDFDVQFHPEPQLATVKGLEAMQLRHQNKRLMHSYGFYGWLETSSKKKGVKECGILHILQKRSPVLLWQLGDDLDLGAWKRYPGQVLSDTREGLQRPDDVNWVRFTAKNVEEIQKGQHPKGQKLFTMRFPRRRKDWVTYHDFPPDLQDSENTCYYAFEWQYEFAIQELGYSARLTRRNEMNEVEIIDEEFHLFAMLGRYFSLDNV